MKRLLILTGLLTLVILTYGKSYIDSLPKCTGYFEYNVIDSTSYGDSVLVQFYSDCEDSVTNYFWDFGDSSYSMEANPSHLYSSEKSVYNVCHAVHMGFVENYHCGQVIINQTSPSCIAYFGFEKDTLAGDSVFVYHFTDLTYGDPISWHWYFGDGEESTERNPYHEYHTKGLYQVILGIETADGCKSFTHQYIFAANIDCDFEISWDVMESMPPQYQFYSIVYDPRMIYSFRPPIWDTLWYNLITYNWDFGDGNYSDDPFPIHVYKNSGTYTVCLQITYQDGTVCKNCVTDYFEGGEFNPCNYTGTYYKDSGYCSYDYIIADDGQKFAVNDVIPNIELIYGTRIKFGYEILTDSLKGCFDIHTLVNITCVELLVTTCELTGTVKDYTGLDGCSYIIELDIGEKIEPVLIDTPFVFRDNQRVKLSYRELTEGASICMVGKLAEITCIEEIPGDTIFPPPWCEEEIILHTSYILNGGECNGSASIEILTPCSAWIYYEMIKNYKILWSTGDTINHVEGLCPGTLYFVSVTRPDGKTFTTAFSIFILNEFSPAWSYYRKGNTYHFNLPVPNGYSVEWKINDGISIFGSDASYTYLESGNYIVKLIVRDNLGSIVYSQDLYISVAVGIPETLSDQINIYPVPLRNELNIELESQGIYETTVRLFNLAGQFIYEKNISLASGMNHISLDVSSIDPGMYLLLIKTPEGILRQKVNK